MYLHNIFKMVEFTYQMGVYVWDLMNLSTKDQIMKK